MHDISELATQKAFLKSLVENAEGGIIGRNRPGIAKIEILARGLVY